MTEKESERRERKRILSRHSAMYKLIGEKITDLKTAGYLSTTTVNISNGGLCLSVPRKVDKGRIVKVGIELEEEIKPITTFCEVRWCKPEGRSYEVGLQFLNLGKKEERYINDFMRTYN